MNTAEYLKNIKPVFKDSKIGDKVFHIFYGWGEIVDFKEFRNHSSIVAEFHQDTFPDVYTYYLDGREYLDQLNPSIYLDEIVIGE